jgi:hypothetical protein
MNTVKSNSEAGLCLSFICYVQDRKVMVVLDNERQFKRMGGLRYQLSANLLSGTLQGYRL